MAYNLSLQVANLERPRVSSSSLGGGLACRWTYSNAQGDRVLLHIQQQKAAMRSLCRVAIFKVAAHAMSALVSSKSSQG